MINPILSALGAVTDDAIIGFNCSLMNLSYVLAVCTLRPSCNTATMFTHVLLVVIAANPPTKKCKPIPQLYIAMVDELMRSVQRAHRVCTEGREEEEKLFDELFLWHHLVFQYINMCERKPKRGESKENEEGTPHEIVRVGALERKATNSDHYVHLLRCWGSTVVVDKD
jgi:hypothetical protein